MHVSNPALASLSKGRTAVIVVMGPRLFLSMPLLLNEDQSTKDSGHRRNGATPVRAWKRNSRLDREDQEPHVVMGPRPFEHGNRSRGVGSDLRSSGRNGATPLRAWKHGMTKWMGHLKS